MQRVTDSLRCIMHKNGYFITNYIDDVIGCYRPEVAVKAFKFLQNLIKKLGLVISEEKLFAPQNCIPCLGIDVNIKTGTFSLLQDFHTDVSWFNAFLLDFNGRVYFDKHSKPPVDNLFVDASLSGVGGIWEGSVYAIPLEFIQGLPLHCTIVHDNDKRLYRLEIMETQITR